MVSPLSSLLLFSRYSALSDSILCAIPSYMSCSLLLGAQVACQQTFIALGDSRTSLFLALLRKVFLLIPLIYILPNFFADKTFAVFLAEPIADFIAVCTTTTLFIRSLRKLMNGGVRA